MPNNPMNAFATALTPIVRMALRSGIGFRDFSVLIKKLFVRVASEDFGIQGRPTNISRVAVMTGLDRKEIKRLREEGGMESQVSASPATDRISRLLSGWHLDPIYQDEQGRPRALPVKANDGLADFFQLARDYAGDVPAVALKKELLRVAVIAEDELGWVRPLTRAYIPPADEVDAILRAGQVLEDLGGTLHHNIFLAAKAAQRFERRAVSSDIDIRHRAEFYAFLASQGQSFLETIDAWLSEHQTAHPDPHGLGWPHNRAQTVRLGAGLFCIDAPDTNREQSGAPDKESERE